MQVTINVPDRLADNARAQGVPVEFYVEQMLAQQALNQPDDSPVESIGGVIDRIFELRKGNKLAGLRTKDLIHEGHKH